MLPLEDNKKKRYLMRKCDVNSQLLYTFTLSFRVLTSSFLQLWSRMHYYLFIRMAKTALLPLYLSPHVSPVKRFSGATPTTQESTMLRLLSEGIVTASQSYCPQSPMTPKPQL